MKETSRKLNIAIYLPTASFILGGGEIVSLIKAQYLSAIGHKVSLISLKVNKIQPYFDSFRHDNPQINFIELKLDHKFDSFEKSALTHEELHQLYWALSRNISQLCIEKQFDIVYTHYSPANLSIPRNMPLLLSLQGVDTKWWYEDHIAVRLADKLIADSDSISEGWKKIYSLKNNIEVVHNGIEEDKFYPLDIKESIDILYIGRLVEYKISRIFT